MIDLRRASTPKELAGLIGLGGSVNMRMTRWITTTALAMVCAGASGMYAQAPAITGIAHVAFRVSDVDKEVNFLGKLGYEESFAITSGPKTMEVFVKVNDRQFIEIYPQTDRSQPLGWMHVCYESDALEGLDALYASHGLNPTKVVKAGAGNLIFSLKDPEGRTTEFTQYMPGSRHTLDKGQHLGSNRVSEELIGFELPVSDLGAARQFYVKMGFDVQDGERSLRVSAANAPDMHIAIHTASAGNQLQILLPVPDARKAADQLHHAGLKVNRQDKIVFARDPDGNSFVLLETGPAQ
jgi:catechol 2,3-dioxygenase-like lactoylglutathione lyase family enzyme